MPLSAMNKLPELSKATPDGLFKAALVAAPPPPLEPAVPVPAYVVIMVAVHEGADVGVCVGFEGFDVGWPLGIVGLLVGCLDGCLVGCPVGRGMGTELSSGVILTNPLPNRTPCVLFRHTIDDGQ